MKGQQPLRKTGKTQCIGKAGRRNGDAREGKYQEMAVGEDRMRSIHMETSKATSRDDKNTGQSRAGNRIQRTSDMLSSQAMDGALRSALRRD